MEKNKLFSESLNYFNKNKINNIILGIFASLIIAGCSTITILGGGFFILIIPLLVLPFIFAIINSYIDSVNLKEITFKSFFKTFTAFFSPIHLSSFRFWKSLLFSILFYIVAEMICSPIAVMVVRNADPALFNEFIDKLQKHLQEVLSDFNNFYEQYKSIFIGLSIIGIYPPSIVLAIVLTYNLSVNSTSIYLKRINHKINPMATTKVFGLFLKQNRWRFYGNFLKLNWPFFILLILGFAGGFCIGYFTNNLRFALTLSYLVGFGATALYSPLFISNMMSLTVYFMDDIYLSYKTAMSEMLMNVLNNPDVPENEKATVQQMLDELRDGTHEDNDENKEDDAS